MQMSSYFIYLFLACVIHCTNGWLHISSLVFSDAAATEECKMSRYKPLQSHYQHANTREQQATSPATSYVHGDLVRACAFFYCFPHMLATLGSCYVVAAAAVDIFVDF